MFVEAVIGAALALHNPVGIPHVKNGANLGSIQIPALKINMPIREGIGDSVLKHGVGHYRDHRFKFAGHDVTPVLGRPYGPFHDIMSLRQGFRIIVTMQGKRYIFRVTGHRIVKPTEVQVLRDRRLVLTTCWPRFTALRRWVVFANRQK
jgi:sortase A